MPNFSGPLQAAGQGWSEASTDAKHALGATIPGPDGKKLFTYVLAGAANLVPGTLIQAPARQANNVDLAPADANTVVPGARTLTLVLGTTEPVTENQYAGGSVLVSNGAGIGFVATIDSHAAGSGGANCTFTLRSADAINFTANSVTRFDLVLNPYRGVIISPTTGTGPIVGAAIAAVPNAQYGWIQTDGYVPVLVEGTPALGQPVARSANTAGAVAIVTTANSTVVTSTANSATIGQMAQVGVNGKVKLVKLNIA